MSTQSSIISLVHRSSRAISPYKHKLPTWLLNILLGIKQRVISKAYTAPSQQENVIHAKDSSDIWGQRHLDDHYWKGMIHWGQIPQVAQYCNQRISGNPNKDYIQYSRETVVTPLRKKTAQVKMLSLCCGIAQLELDLLDAGFCDFVVGYDVSKDCIDSANQKAKERGLADRAYFKAVDLNTFEIIGEDLPKFVKDKLPREKFDLVFNEAALHHIKNLEHLHKVAHKACHAESYFINHDFIGPNHHQWSQRQLKIINDILSWLPAELRASRTNLGAIHESKNALSMDEMMRIDPTEGVRSEDIISVQKQYFDIVEYKEFGGTILHMLFNDIAGNFMKPEHSALVQSIVYLEDKLLESNYIPSDFAYWVSKPKLDNNLSN